MSLNIQEKDPVTGELNSLSIKNVGNENTNTNHIKVSMAIAIEALEKTYKYRWHDVRKNPDDLPKEPGYYLVKRQQDRWTICDYVVYGYTPDRNYWSTLDNVFAWREIEPFEESKEGERYGKRITFTNSK